MKPIIVFHRGRHGQINKDLRLEENTLPAIEQAILENAQIIEVDVWSNLKICHDPQQSAVLTLTEVMKVVNGRCGINIEIKSPSTAPQVIRLVKEAISSGVWAAEQFVFSSFHHLTAIQCKVALPEIRVAAISDGIPLSQYVRELHSKGIANLHLHWANIYMDIESGYQLQSILRELEMQLWVWTVNDIDVCKTVVDYGVDAIFTDKPDLLSNYLEHYDSVK